MLRTRFEIGCTLLFVLIVSSLSFAQEGTLEKGTITSPALGGETKGFFVYLPPSYTTSEKEYPSFYALHRLYASEISLTGMRHTLDRMIQAGEIGEMIVVFPDGDNSWYHREYEPYIAKELVDQIDAQYRTIPDRNSRGITGESSGGYGAMHLALKFPEVFAVVVAQAGSYVLEDVDLYLEQPVLLNGIKIVHGRADEWLPVERARALDEKLTEEGIDHVYMEHGGGHIFLDEESLTFLSDHLHPVHEIARLRDAVSATASPEGIVVGEPTSLEVAVTLDAAPEAIESVQEILLDLSPLGISSQLPLEDAGGGRYTFSGTITPLRHGRHRLPLVMETRFAWDIEGARYSLSAIGLDVYLASDVYSVYQDQMAFEWEARVFNGELDLAASEVVYGGSSAQVVTLESDGIAHYTFMDPEGFSTFGYTGLGFWINPGTSSMEKGVVILSTSKRPWPVKLGEDLGITLAPEVWQKVTIPLEEFGLTDTYLKQIRFQGVEGTFYLDDLGLEVAEYLLSEAVATPERVIPDGEMRTLLTVQAAPNVLEPGDPPITVTADLTPIGGVPDAVMFDDGTGGDRVAGDGIYTLRTTVDPEIPNGHKDLLLTCTDRHLRGVRTHLEVGVLPAEDLHLYRDGLEEGWDQRVFKAEVDPASTEYVHDGSYAYAIALESTGQVEYIMGDPDGLTTFGYATLEFWIHPGSASIKELKITASRYEGRISKLKVLSLVEELGVSFGSEDWQLVSIPMDALELTDARLEYIRWAGDAEGTFYIDDMRLIPEAVLESLEPTAVSVSGGGVVPTGYVLSQNYPNPFNPETTIRYELAEAGVVQVLLYTVSGQLIRTLVDGEYVAGNYSVTWDGRDDAGRDVASGVYVSRMEVGGFRAVRKLVLVR